MPVTVPGPGEIESDKGQILGPGSKGRYGQQEEERELSLNNKNNSQVEVKLKSMNQILTSYE